MQGYKVLIVDDSPFMRKVFSDVIDADAAFNVLTTASNGKEAVDLALKLKPDIITMDLEMPQMNGIEALQRIMAIQPTPIIMLSAVTDNGTRDTIKALQYGAIDFIRKPDGAVKLDIRQVGEQLLEKLHIALETMSSGAFRMLPAVEEKNDPSFPLAPVQAMQTTAMQDEVEKPDNPAETLSHKPLTESKRSVVTPAKPKNLDIARKLDNIAEIPKPIGSPPALSLSDTGGGLLKSIPSRLFLR
jgi:two-component system chemotaxis response regulator CheB